jgi:hypothetical protein
MHFAAYRNEGTIGVRGVGPRLPCLTVAVCAQSAKTGAYRSARNLRGYAARHAALQHQWPLHAGDAASGFDEVCSARI